MSDKRKGYITWDEYFMGVAKLSSMRSKDPSIMVFRPVVPMKNSRGEKMKRTRIMRSISMLPTVNSMRSSTIAEAVWKEVSSM